MPGALLVSISVYATVQFLNELYTKSKMAYEARGFSTIQGAEEA